MNSEVLREIISESQTLAAYGISRLYDDEQIVDTVYAAGGRGRIHRYLF